MIVTPLPLIFKVQETGDELKMQQEKGKKRNQEQKGRNPNNPLKK